jgi:mannose-6-phosphate isomerase-like protein (cupin superfamily)
MSPEPVVVHQADRQWERWPEEEAAERGDAEWKTLISAGVTQSEALTLGLARLPANGTLRPHRHEQHEAYLVLEGTGVVTIDGSSRPVAPGATVLIPGNVVQSIESTRRDGAALRVCLRGGRLRRRRVRVRSLVPIAPRGARRQRPRLPARAHQRARPADLRIVTGYRE